MPRSAPAGKLTHLKGMDQVKRVLAAFALMGALAAASSTLAEPQPASSLEFLGRTDQFSYFVANDAQQKSDAGYHAWVLAALDKITPTAEGDRIAGAWLRLEIDCAARSLSVRESMLIREDFSITERTNDADPWDVARDDSPYGVLRDYLCSRKALEPEIHAQDLRDALDLAQSIANGANPERRLPAPGNRT